MLPQTWWPFLPYGIHSSPFGPRRSAVEQRTVAAPTNRKDEGVANCAKRFKVVRWSTSKRSRPNIARMNWRKSTSFRSPRHEDLDSRRRKKLPSCTLAQACERSRKSYFMRPLWRDSCHSYPRSLVKRSPCRNVVCSKGPTHRKPLFTTRRMWKTDRPEQ